jgi:hypothetical protein
MVKKFETLEDNFSFKTKASHINTKASIFNIAVPMKLVKLNNWDNTTTFEITIKEIK